MRVKGECPLGNRVGDAFIINDTTPQGMCLGAFTSLLPAAQVMMYGGSFPWEDDPDVAHIGCPDHVNQVVYRLEKITSRET